VLARMMSNASTTMPVVIIVSGTLYRRDKKGNRRGEDEGNVEPGSSKSTISTAKSS